MNNSFEGLTAIVQYARKAPEDPVWITMAAFDFLSIAEKYAQDCGEGNVHWIYRAVDLKS